MNVYAQPRNLVVCLDGTGNLVRGSGETNVVRIYEGLDLTDPERQIAYYDPGVGTFSAAGAWGPIARWLTRTLGLAFGIGLRHNLAEAYTWLLQNWRPGDRIFLFGFSRGAYNALAVSGALRAVGLSRPGTENLVPYIVRSYARRGAEKRISWAEISRMKKLFGQTTVLGRRRPPDGDAGADETVSSTGSKPQPGQSIPVQYMGIFDAVKANGFLKWDPRWPYTRSVENVLRLRHAASLDERRRPYRPYVVNRLTRRVGAQWSRPVIEEAWFAGVHSDVGGGYDDAPGDEGMGTALGRISLKWVLEGAVHEGLLVRARKTKIDTTVAERSATQGTVHRQSRLWALLGYKRRTAHAFELQPAGTNDPTRLAWIDDDDRRTTRSGVRVHDSVRARMAADGRYRPRLPDDVHWVDAEWLTHRPRGCPEEVSAGSEAATTSG